MVGWGAERESRGGSGGGNHRSIPPSFGYENPVRGVPPSCLRPLSKRVSSDVKEPERSGAAERLHREREAGERRGKLGRREESAPRCQPMEGNLHSGLVLYT